jgi:hypothetical protein
MASVEVIEAVRETETEADRVLRWRVDELVRAGYTERLALRLASRRHVDLHQAVELLARGCPPETAARILI